MTQEVAAVAVVDPLVALIEGDINTEKRRLKALPLTGDAKVLAGEVAGTVLQLLQDSLRQIHVRLGQAYVVLGEHAEQLDDIEDSVEEIGDAISAGSTTIQPDDAQKIVHVAEAFILLAGEFVEGRVPTVSDASVRATLQAQIDNARDVLAIVSDSVVSPGDGDSDEEGGEEGEEDDA